MAVTFEFSDVEVEDLERARSFLQAAGALDRQKQETGEIPELTFLERVGATGPRAA